MRVLELLRSSLVTELAFLLRYNHLTQDIYALPLRLAQFMLHACGQLSYASKLSFHISELGGDLNCSPAMLMQCSDAIHESNHDIRSVILANLRIEQITLQEFKYIFQRAAAEDTSSQPILAQIVEDGGNHIEELVSWLRH
jgi:bacterioferritin (cytochrome b1)